ncbi:polymorphic toxin type 28 domain-containing protein, partial [Paenibacillus odorifer]
ILREKMEGKSDSNHSIKDVEVKAVEGTGNGGRIFSSVDDLSDIAKSKITTSQRATLNQQERTYSHLTEMDLKGAQRDLVGDPVPKPGGGYYDHAQEVSDAYRGLVDLNRSWEGMLKNPNLDNELRQLYASKLNEVNATMKKIEDMFAPNGGVYPPK